jgi:hypothetical protein
MNQWQTFIAWVRDTCANDLDSSKWKNSTKNLPLVNTSQVLIEGELYAPFQPDEMGENFLGGINVRLIATFPQLKQTILAARLATGDPLPWPPLSVSFARLLPRDIVYGGNVFPFTTLRDMSSQLDEVVGFCERLLYPIYVDMQNYELLAHWRSKPDWMGQFGWHVMTAAYSVANKNAKLAQQQIQDQLTFLETFEPNRTYSTSTEVNKMADKATLRSASSAKQDLRALIALLPTGLQSLRS